MPEIAEMMAGVLTKSDSVRYRLFAWCIMPNHVHVVFQPKLGHQLQDFLHSWKSYSAQMANRILRRRGDFWQREYYDRILRDADELGRAVAYTAENPKRANLTNWKWVFVTRDWN